MTTFNKFICNYHLLKNSNLISSYLKKNGMSQFPSYFVKPIYNKEKLDDLFKTGEAEKLAHIPTRPPLNDQSCSIFYDADINLFINYVMKSGRKILARELVEKALQKVKRLQLEKYHKTNDEEKKAKILLDPKEVFHRAVENCKPILQLTPIKRGGVKYQVPVPITDKRSQFISMKWIIEAAKDKDRNTKFPEKLAYELVDASNNTGRVVKRKQDLHRQCEANRAYAHYRWS